MIRSVYIAAPYPIKDEAITLRDQLRASGILVTSRWLDHLEDSDAQAANVDLEDVRAAVALVLINPERYANMGTGGRHVEFGAALVYGMPIYILGVKSNVFHTLNQCSVASTALTLIHMLKIESAYSS